VCLTDKSTKLAA